MLFPNVSGENLEGRKFTLPRDFEQKRNLLVIAFKREQQHESETWTPLIKRLITKYANLAFYELPTIAALSPLRRWWINSAMRSALPDPGTRHATITLYIEKEPFKQALEIPDEDHIYTLLVDQTGTILWRSQGPLNQQKEQDLAAFLQQTSA